MIDPIAGVKLAAAHLHAARKFLSTAETVYDKAVAHLALTAETRRLDAERRADKYGNKLADLTDRCAQECVGLLWSERTAAERLLLDAIEDGRPTAYGPVPNDKTNPTPGTSRQDPGETVNGKSGSVERLAGDYQDQSGAKT